MSYAWLAKYAFQKVVSRLPFGHQINTVCQKTLGGLRKPVLFGYPRTLTMLWLLRQSGVSLRGTVCVELGTGWDLSSALTLVRTGAADVYTYDHLRHLVPEYCEMAAAAIDSRRIPSDTNLPFSPPFAELAELVGVPRGQIHYRAPYDARRTGLSPESVDLYYSLATLEHIPLPTVRELLAESFRILKPGSVCYHYIQPSMHSWRGKESSIDYLVFSSSTWERWIANPIAYENRLRAVEYLGLLTDAGFEIVDTRYSVDQVALSKLPHMRIAEEFSRFTPEQLAQEYVWVIARKPDLEQRSA